MDYAVTAELAPPAEVVELDPLQQEGVAAVLDRHLAMVEGVSGPGESEIDVLDYRITVHQGGVSVLLALDAPSLQAAEEGAASVLDELIVETELLLGWTVAESAVRLTEDEFNERLAAADEVDADGELQAAIEEALETSAEPAMDAEHWKRRLDDLAPRLQAFGPSAFGIEGEGATLAAGALVHSVRVVTDEIFYDELALAVNNATVADAVGLLVLEELPPCYDHRYDAFFARSFVLASAAVAARLTEPAWTPPRSVAEALALRLIINEARVVLEAAELMSWDDSEPVFDAFAARAFGDVEHDELYEVDVPLAGEAEAEVVEKAAKVEAELHNRGLAFDQWFLPTDGGSYHPYLDSP
ncbi:hypothetical protein EIL87_17315 [Saccharopolyspora rhizosphaerae]|uniref:Uncharacterized protein n=1 Tax=Saccharopolyspora rhizosphaerae TaxID=2492662 RepID=A0A3R8Q2V6_9PSEU|nr:hypothetical protein [Saccharopolyspora rhizosphaerae]RRO15759.1 hypothetical protein EIL87_17315 [Saccharopolyspora rhizosphaerae]